MVMTMDKIQAAINRAYEQVSQVRQQIVLLQKEEEVLNKLILMLEKIQKDAELK
jgi:hypothetical protein